MSNRRITQIQLHENDDMVRVTIHEWPDTQAEMDSPVILGKRASQFEYDVEVLVPSASGRFSFDPFETAVQGAASLAVQAMMGDQVERRRRQARGLGAPGRLWPA
jgi:hypothetical protein